MNILRSPELPGAGQSMTPDTSNPTPDAKSGPAPIPESWNDPLRLMQAVLTFTRDYGVDAGNRLIKWINDERRRIDLGR